MLSKLFLKIPDPFRLYIEAGISLGAIVLVLWLAYVIHDRNTLKDENKVLTNNKTTLVGYIDTLATENIALRNSIDEEINHVRKTPSGQKTPVALLDTIGRLHPPR